MNINDKVGIPRFEVGAFGENKVIKTLVRGTVVDILENGWIVVHTEDHPLNTMIHESDLTVLEE